MSFKLWGKTLREQMAEPKATQLPAAVAAAMKCIHSDSQVIIFDSPPKRRQIHRRGKNRLPDFTSSGILTKTRSLNTGTPLAHGLLIPVRREGSGKHPKLETTSQEETDMEFASIIVVSNVLMALFIYIVVAKIWQD